jgi:hypothetical protein
MARKPKVQTRLSPDVKEQLDSYQDSRDITQAVATRRLIEAGLEAEPIEVDDLDTEGEEFDTTLNQRMRTGQMVGGAVIAISVAVLVAIQLPEAAVAAVAAALGGAIGGSLR